MKRFLSNMMVLVVVCIIMLHAVVPHHDCCGEEGVVFGADVACHCNHHHEDQEHHNCLLQDLLSKLVISQKGDETSMAVMTTPEFDVVCLPGMERACVACVCETGWELVGSREQTSLPSLVSVGSVGLRAPPAC